jgi:hypothetical protein
MLALAGETEMRTPESMVIFAVPVFFLSAFDVAVMVIVSPVRSLGNVEGAVNTTVRLVELAGMLPVLSLQGLAVEVVVVVPLVVVVVKVQVQTTEVSVAPVTVALKVWF